MLLADVLHLHTEVVVKDIVANLPINHIKVKSAKDHGIVVAMMRMIIMMATKTMNVIRNTREDHAALNEVVIHADEDLIHETRETMIATENILTGHETDLVLVHVTVISRQDE